MSIGQGRPKLPRWHEAEGVAPEAIGWRVPFSEEPHLGTRLAHFVVCAAKYDGLGYRACYPGHVVSLALLEGESGRSRRCGRCRVILDANNRLLSAVAPEPAP